MIKQADAPISVGLVDTIAEVLPEMLRRNVTRDIVTDQTSAHDLREGYIPVEHPLQETVLLPASDPKTYDSRVLHSMVLPVNAILELPKRSAICFDYVNNLRGQLANHRNMPEAF